MSVPSSVIHILSGVPLNNSYEHSLFFVTRIEQTSYFHSKIEKSFTKYTYLRPDQAINVAGDIANARRWNYLMFQNDSGKWYYHFITKVEYVNDSTVKLHLDLDVLQTFMFDWDMKECFVERMHVKSDGIGENTIDEGLECGDLVDRSVVDQMFDDYCIMMLTAVDEDRKSAWAKLYDGVFSGLAIYAIERKNYTKLGAWLDEQSANGTIEAVVTMWMYPKSMVNIYGSWDDGEWMHHVTGQSAIEITNVTDYTYKIGTYTPKNNKLFTYPYKMLYVSNNMGGSAVFKQEWFQTTTTNKAYRFKMMGALAPDAGIQLVPYDYGKRMGYNYEHSLSMGSFPTCAWDSDTYKVWLAQNQNTYTQSIKLGNQQMTMGYVGLALGAVTAIMGDGGNGILSGVNSILSAQNNIAMTMAQKKDMEVQPPQARGVHSGNINLAHQRAGFTFYFKTVTEEYARQIDEYFSRYGYQVNRTMVPPMHNRERFTYVKTKGCFVTGSVGSEDQLKIQAIFDKGVTWWSDWDNVGDFTSDNPCI